MKKIYAIALMAFVGVASANAQAFKLDKNYVIKTAMKVADGKTVVNSETDGAEVTADMLKKIQDAYLDEEFNTLPISGGTATGANYHVLTADYTDPETGISFAAGTYATLNSSTEIKFKDTSNPQGVSNIKQVVFYLASQGQLQFYAREYNEDTDGENYVNFEGDPTNRKLKSYKAPGFQTETWTEMYVNYYDRYEKIEGENPTIGILLCKQSDEALVDLTLPENANIYAKEYKLYLPDKKLLQKKLKEWLDEEQN